MKSNHINVDHQRLAARRQWYRFLEAIARRNPDENSPQQDSSRGSGVMESRAQEEATKEEKVYMHGSYIRMISPLPATYAETKLWYNTKGRYRKSATS